MDMSIFGGKLIKNVQHMEFSPPYKINSLFTHQVTSTS